MKGKFGKEISLGEVMKCELSASKQRVCVEGCLPPLIVHGNGWGGSRCLVTISLKREHDFRLHAVNQPMKMLKHIQTKFID